MEDGPDGRLDSITIINIESESLHTRTLQCPLCLCTEVQLLYKSLRKNLKRDYITCLGCKLVFVPASYHLGRQEERGRYLQHNNDIHDPDYRVFLSRLSEQILPYLAPGFSGLDYGAGPGPALAAMLGEKGCEMSIYDPHFHRDTSVLRAVYDFIVCTETAEHFSNPASDFALLNNLLTPGGLLGLMTSVFYEHIDFENWYYRLDPTHLNFYTPETMEWIARRWDWAVWSPVENVYLFRKP